MRGNYLGVPSKHLVLCVSFFSINMEIYSKLHEFGKCKCILILICFRGVEKSRLDRTLVTFWMMKVTVLGEWAALSQAESIQPLYIPYA